jgi:hypothetical protein
VMGVKDGLLVNLLFGYPVIGIRWSEWEDYPRAVRSAVKR